ncbi:MAG TPA: substrate-binding domain-containing protein [Sphingomonas sp.]|nr:substrate-binding domain-containing protein [Sphingomonas sp.]
MGRRAFLGSAAAALALPARAQRLTPAVQRIDPRPALPDSPAARAVAGMPRYRPEQSVSGAIRLWGHGNRKLPWMHYLVDQWAADFARFHPGAQLDYRLYGTSSGIPALYNGLGDIAMLGEEILPDAARAFERVKGYPPTGIELMTGSMDIRNFDYAQMVFVHRDNPIERVSLVELDAILGTEHRRGARNIRRWGELGLGGAWADRPIVPYSWAIDDSFGFYVQNAVLMGSHRWNPALREFAHITYPDGSIYDHGQQILDALAKDPAGIAVSNIRYAVAEVKPLPLAVTPAGPWIAASDATLIDRSYPLARTLPAVIDRPPDGRIDPKVREFLRYILSREGQEAVNRDGRYLPLSPTMLEAQRRVLA